MTLGASLAESLAALATSGHAACVRTNNCGSDGFSAGIPEYITSNHRACSAYSLEALFCFRGMMHGLEFSFSTNQCRPCSRVLCQGYARGRGKARKAELPLWIKPCSPGSSTGGEVTGRPAHRSSCLHVTCGPLIRFFQPPSFSHLYRGTGVKPDYSVSGNGMLSEEQGKMERREWKAVCCIWLECCHRHP